MEFHSIAFLLFFIGVFFLYWFAFKKSFKLQNILLLLASYFFYAWWDWRFLALIIAASGFNFWLAIQIENSDEGSKRKWLLRLGMLQGVGMLVYFKYFNFFIESLNNLFSSFSSINIQTLSIIVPLGISFFTFRTISYLLDVDKGKIESCKNPITFFTYVAFFPSLVSGPIDKAREFIPQLEKKRSFEFNKSLDAIFRIVWGLFKKLIIADNCASITNQIFSNYENLPASVLVVGMFLYAIQIYADFSGYSDMAIGLGRLLGFKVAKNFNFPYFAQNIADFWRKWHISLTTWLTEYVFTPLSIAFRDFGNWGLTLAIILNFSIIGIWHGANWTYLLFGIVHGCFYIPLIIKGNMNKKKKMAKDKVLPTFKELVNISITFTFVMLSFVIFKSDSITDAFAFYKGVFSKSIFSIPRLTGQDNTNMLLCLVFSVLLIIVDWRHRHREFVFENIVSKSNVTRIAILVLLVTTIYYLSSDSKTFIYGQF